MCKKLLILSLSMAMLFVITVPITPVDAGGKNVNINWQVAGPVVNNIDMLVNISPDPQNPNFVWIPHYLINISAQGPPGPAQITLVGYGDFTTPSPGCIWEISIEKNDMVARFSDLSLLFAKNISGSLCFDGTKTIWQAVMEIVGGTGRFEDASGDFTGNGIGYSISGGALSAETGEIIGTIELSD